MTNIKNLEELQNTLLSNVKATAIIGHTGSGKSVLGKALLEKEKTNFENILLYNLKKEDYNLENKYFQYYGGGDLNGESSKKRVKRFIRRMEITVEDSASSIVIIDEFKTFLDILKYIHGEKENKAIKKIKELMLKGKSNNTKFMFLSKMPKDFPLALSPCFDNVVLTLKNISMNRDPLRALTSRFNIIDEEEIKKAIEKKKGVDRNHVFYSVKDRELLKVSI